MTKRKQKTFYVNVYEVSREYGGPEEGGWWYTVRYPVESKSGVKTRDVEPLVLKLQDEYGKGYSVRIETERARKHPAHRPFYQ